MRVLIFGSAKPDRMEACLQRAMARAGHVTRLLDDRRLARTLGRAAAQRYVRFRARRFRADVVIFGKGLGLELDTVAELVRGRRSAVWYQDPPYFREPERPQVAHVIAVGRLVDTFFVTGFDREWRALGLNAKYLPSAGDRDLAPVPASPKFAADVTFIGSGYDEGRARFLAEVGRRYRLRVWGPGWDPWGTVVGWGGGPVYGRAFAAACSSSAIVLGILPAIAAGASNYTSDRPWLTMLAGGFYLGPRAPALGRLLCDGVHCAWYDDAADCLERIGHYLVCAHERERIRAAGERHVRAHHTYDQRVPHLLSGEAFVIHQ